MEQVGDPFLVGVAEFAVGAVEPAWLENEKPLPMEVRRLFGQDETAMAWPWRILDVQELVVERQCLQSVGMIS